MSTVQFQHLAKLIASSGNILPSAAMEAIKSDLSDKLRSMDAEPGCWVSVDPCGSVYVYGARPALDEDLDMWCLNGDWVRYEHAGVIPSALLNPLRLSIYWRDYLLEL